jgi:hypothetical protein
MLTRLARQFLRLRPVVFSSRLFACVLPKRTHLQSFNRIALPKAVPRTFQRAMSVDPAPERVTHYRKDYTPPPHTIDTVSLNFILGEDTTRVEAKMKMKAHHQPAGQSLFLNGRGDVELVSLLVNGTVFLFYLFPSSFFRTIFLCVSHSHCQRRGLVVDICISVCPHRPSGGGRLVHGHSCGPDIGRCRHPFEPRVGLGHCHPHQAPKQHVAGRAL